MPGVQLVQIIDIRRVDAGGRIVFAPVDVVALGDEVRQRQWRGLHECVGGHAHPFDHAKRLAFEHLGRAGQQVQVIQVLVLVGPVVQGFEQTVVLVVVDGVFLVHAPRGPCLGRLRPQAHGVAQELVQFPLGHGQVGPASFELALDVLAQIAHPHADAQIIFGFHRHRLLVCRGMGVASACMEPVRADARWRMPSSVDARP